MDGGGMQDLNEKEESLALGESPTDALNKKEESPPLGVDNLRSTKKVRIREKGVREELQVSEEAMDVQMGGTEGVVLYQNKLLNIDKKGSSREVREEIVVGEGDYTIRKDGGIPLINFSMKVKEMLVKGMERTLVIHLLGETIKYGDLLTKIDSLWQPRGSYQVVDVDEGFYFVTFDFDNDYSKVLTGGPCMVFGAYLTVQPRTICFNPATMKISRVVAWVRVPGLSFRYYHKNMLRAIGKLLGEVVKIEYMTEARGRGKYARIAVLIDLMNPLIPYIRVDGKTYMVAYEGLPLICFGCGKYGHIRECCKEGKLGEKDGVVDTRMEVIEQETVLPESAIGKSVEPNNTLFGTWLQVRYPKRGNKQ